MSESIENPAAILNAALKLIREAEAKVIKLKERAVDLELDPEAESASEKLKNGFIEHICGLIDCWHDLPGKTPRESTKGVVHSILTVLDGECGGMPPFAVRPLDENGREGEDIAGGLHGLFFQKQREKGNQ